MKNCGNKKPGNFGDLPKAEKGNSLEFGQLELEGQWHKE
jgi:hypothetical protein